MSKTAGEDSLKAIASWTEGKTGDLSSLTTTNKSNLVAATNEVKSNLDGRLKQNAGAPTTATVGTVGMLLEDTTNGKLYQCTAVTPGTDPDPTTYTWTEVGGGPNVVQTKGISSLDVMSQEATTQMIYPSFGSHPDRIRIGANATSSGNYSTAIGEHANGSGTESVAVGSRASALSNNSIAVCGGDSGTEAAIVYSGSHAGIAIGFQALSGQGSPGENIKGAVAIGASSKATATGQFDIGAQSTTYGYNSSHYRLLTGVHDPQTAHDAATKGYVDSVAPVITMTNTDPGEGAPLAANHFIAYYE